MKDKTVVFIDGVRTAFGRLGGSLKDFTAEELGSIALKGLIDKSKICERGVVDSVFAGTAFHVARALDPARWIVLDAGLPVTTTASYVEMQCGSAIDSINHAAWKILCGQADTIIAGGMESFSQCTVKFSRSSQPYRFIAPVAFVPSLSPEPEEGDTNMGITAETLQE